jgi:hypothetical protein
MSNYTVHTRDVDGSDRRSYKSIDKAMARFAEMAGHSLETAIREQFHDTPADELPTVRAVKSVRAVSDYGTVVVFLRNCEPEAEPVAAVPDLLLSDDYDALEARHNEIGEIINEIDESAAERMTQYRSECAMFGDAGPGQHPSCWAQRSDDEKGKLLAEAELIGARMRALRPELYKPLPPMSDAERARIAAIPDDIPF